MFMAILLILKKLETAQISFKKGTANETVVYSCTGMLLGNKMELLYNNMDASQKP